MGEACSKHPKKTGNVVVQPGQGAFMTQSVVSSRGMLVPPTAIPQTRSAVNHVATTSYVSAPTRIQDAIIVQSVSRRDVYAQAAPPPIQVHQQTTSYVPPAPPTYVMPATQTYQPPPVTVNHMTVPHTSTAPANGLLVECVDCYGNTSMVKKVDVNNGLVPVKFFDGYKNTRRFDTKVA